MNQQQALQRLLKLLKDFVVHPEFAQELIALIKGSGIELSFFRILATRLSLLLEAPEKAMLRSSEFETLGDGLYSMHVDSGQHNTRILYGILPGNHPVLLHAFDERSGHRRTSYAGHTPIAQDRFQDMLQIWESD